MAKSLTARFGLQRWSADADTQSRSEFDNDNAQTELLGAIARQGVAAARGSASTWARSTYWSTDTGALDYSDGTTWQPVPALAAPRGALGYAEINASVTGFTSTDTDLVSVGVTVAGSTNRRLRLTAAIYLSSTVAGDLAQVSLHNVTDGGQSRIAYVPLTTDTLSHTVVSHLPAVTPGAKTYKVSAKRFSGTGTLTAFATTSSKAAWLLVEDIGV